MMEEIEIPEAIREHAELPQKSGFPLPLLAGGIATISIVGLLSLWLLAPRKPVPPTVSSSAIESKKTTGKSKPQPQVAAPSPPIAKAPVAKQKIDLLGHLPYNVAPASELTSVTGNGELKMRTTAANKFQQMQAAARADGIILNPLSGFRDTNTQEQLFFGVKEHRVQDAAQRAEVSAPPGYSEHHTGYAVDIGDGNVPSSNLETSFADTPAFRWLEQNALKYSFELSFPPNNKQGVSYEPWHWRFVGDRNSLETFYKVRN